MTLGYDDIQLVADQMIDIMYAYKGIGLAASQVGLPLRMFVMRNTDSPKDPLMSLVFVNPVIVERSMEVYLDQEGCLSTPGVRTSVSRSKIIDVEFDTMPIHPTSEARTTWHFEGLYARCVQHEIDHLDGIMFFDHIKGNLPRKMLLEKYTKNKRKYVRL